VLVQTQVPGEILGRAATVLGSLLAASQPVGALVFGAMVGVISIGETFMISGAIVSVVSAVLFFLFKELSSAKY
jgi:hypothetical protein